MTVKAYFTYPEFAKKMADGNRLAHVLGKMRHPFLYKHWKSGFDIHPKQKLAIARLTAFMGENKKRFELPIMVANSGRLMAFAAAEEISKIPNYAVLMGTQRLASEMKNTAALCGLSCATYLEQVGEIRITSDYRDLLVSLISLSGAQKGDALVVGTKGNGVLFMLEVGRGKTQDALGLELVRLCAEALGGKFTRMEGDSKDTFEMVLPARIK